jgi:hypothetical protein
MLAILPHRFAHCARRPKRAVKNFDTHRCPPCPGDTPTGGRRADAPHDRPAGRQLAQWFRTRSSALLVTGGSGWSDRIPLVEQLAGSQSSSRAGAHSVCASAGESAMGTMDLGPWVHSGRVFSARGDRRHPRDLYQELGVRGALAVIRTSCVAPWIDPGEVSTGARKHLGPPDEARLPGHASGPRCGDAVQSPPIL